MRGKLLLLSCVAFLLVLLISGCSTGPPATKANPQIDGSGSYRASFGKVEVTLDLPTRAYSDVRWILNYLSPAPSTGPEPAYTLVSFIVRNSSPRTVDCAAFSFFLDLKHNQNTSSETIAQFVKAFPNIFPNANDALIADPWQAIANGSEKVPCHQSDISYRVCGVVELDKIKGITVTYSGPSGGSKEMKKL